jgi:hypothetical protein
MTLLMPNQAASHERLETVPIPIATHRRGVGEPQR